MFWLSTRGYNTQEYFLLATKEDTSHTALFFES